MILQMVHQKKGFQIVWLFFKDFLKKQAGFFFVLKAESAQGTKIIAILVVPELDIILVNFDLRKRNSEEVIGSFVENMFFSIEDQLVEGFSGSRFLEIGDAFLHVTSSEEAKTVPIVWPQICGIPAQVFEIIVRRLIGRMTVLFQMKGGEIELLRGRDCFWRFHDAGRFRNGLKLRNLERMGDQQGGTIGNGDGQGLPGGCQDRDLLSWALR